MPESLFEILRPLQIASRFAAIEAWASDQFFKAFTINGKLQVARSGVSFVLQDKMIDDASIIPHPF